jgi:hypothetical protein
MLAHDRLSYFRTEREAARTIREGTAEFTAAALAEESAEPARLNEYFVVQRRLRQLLANRPVPAATNEPDPRWLISDLVTFGSPLTHAEFLIAADRCDLEVRKAARELPQSPPYREFLDLNVLKRAEATKIMPIATPSTDTRLMSYPVVNVAETWMLHHAAPFAAVRWTNVFDDVIGGPLGPVFGPAIVDIDLKALRCGCQSPSFTHTKYWSLDEASRIKACREAVNLLDREAPWRAEPSMLGRQVGSV